MSDNKTNFFYKVGIECLVLESTIDSRTRNTKLLHDARDGNTAVFDSFLQYFALMRHGWGNSLQ